MHDVRRLSKVAETAPRRPRQARVLASPRSRSLPSCAAARLNPLLHPETPAVVSTATRGQRLVEKSILIVDKRNILLAIFLPKYINFIQFMLFGTPYLIFPTSPNLVNVYRFGVGVAA